MNRDSSRRLRVGIVDYLNAWPLAWGFLSGRLEDTYEAIYLPPAEVASELEAGRLDVGLIPSIEVQRQPDLSIVPGLCVAATHEVRSVVLVSEKPIERVTRVALDRNSRTSAALVEILLRDKYGIDAAFESAEPDLEAMLAGADAALVIGDPALHIDRRRWQVWDLAAEWRELTGKPFVFAVWALRNGSNPAHSANPANADPRSLVRALAKSLDLGVSELDLVIERAIADLELDESEVRSYLTRNLSYRLDDEAMDGLREFYRRAAHHGLVSGSRPLDFA